MKPEIIHLTGLSKAPIRIWEILKFAFKSQPYIFMIILTLIVLVILTNNPEEILKKFIQEWKDNNTGTIFNIITLFFIVTVWFADIRNDWRQSLKKYLSVSFLYNEKKIDELSNSSYPAQLISESDIRALAQQIGQQNNNNNRLNLDSSKYSYTKTISYDRNSKLACSPFWHYEVTVELKSPPSKGKTYKTTEEYLDTAVSNLNQLNQKFNHDNKDQIVEILESIQNDIQEIKKVDK